MSGPVEKTVVTTCTRDCPDGCSILATVRDGRLVALKGNPDHPVTRGFLCRRSRDYVRRVYSPNRILHPMKRVDGGWERVSWDEALDLAAGKIAEYRDRYGTLSLMHYQDNGSMAALKMLNARFFNLLGGVTAASGTLCGGAGIAGQTMDFGYRTAHEPTDVPNSRLVILWGRNPMATNVHLVPFLKAARAKGATLVLIDPVRTRSAELCDLHYQPIPGSDGYLAAAIGKLLLESGAVDRGFVERHTEGFAEYHAALEGFPLPWLSAQCGIPLEEIRRLASMFGTLKPAAIWTGWGLQRREFGAEIYRLVDAIVALTGNIGVPGGGVNHGMEEREYWDWDLKAPEAARVSRGIPKATLGEGILEAQDPPVKMIFVTGANPANQAPHSLKVREAFARTEFVVVIDSFLTDTADLAYLFLPTTSPFEEEDLVGSYGHQWLGPVNPIIGPLGEARTDLQIFQGLAERLGLAGMEGTATEWLRRLAAPLQPLGITLERLREGPLRHPTAPTVPFQSRVFPTPSGRFRFTSEVPPNPSSARDGSFVLISGHPEGSIHSQILPEDQGKTLPVRMNPLDAAGLGLVEGDGIAMAAGEGRVEGRVVLDATLGRGVLQCDQGGWLKFRVGINRVVPGVLSRHGLCAGFYEAIVTAEPTPLSPACRG
ncbi:MAG: molybdopterin-dependent oxidoreductase [Chloroflexi bacterium]|nr:molybdopterin-dependent oxidoreductase [Chloroflexota bacterium]